MIRAVDVEEVSCPGCGADGPATKEATGPDFDNHACGDQQFTLVQCAACRTFYLNPRPTTAMLPLIYDAEDYYAYTFSERGNRFVLQARRRRNREKARAALQAAGCASSRAWVLDIGAGDGALLEAFGAEGVPVRQLVGLDIEPRAIERLGSYGFGARLGRIEDANLEPSHYDVISLIQVIEHVAAPADVLARCRDALRPGGICLIETPNVGSWDRRFFRRRLWGGYHFPRHWTLWDAQTLGFLLQREGFDIVSVATPAAAVTWAWSLNHVAQDIGLPHWAADAFGLKNPFLLGALWALEFLPSRVGRSANLRVLALAR